MTGLLDTGVVSEFAQRVKARLAKRAGELEVSAGRGAAPMGLMTGKMLRTHFAGWLALGGGWRADEDVLIDVCAATEMVHTATLCHDDVVDGALVRRSSPALWRAKGAAAAVMIGDWLLADAAGIIADTSGGRYLALFLAKARETCAAEIEHEIALRGTQLGVETCVRLARGKTGPLFSFVGRVCGGDDDKLAAALEEAGYRVGTAYQLADDLIDAVGSQAQAGKTLGTDTARGKYTLAQGGVRGAAFARECAVRELREAVRCVERWPGVRTGLESFLEEGIRSALTGAGIRVGTAQCLGRYA